MDININKSVDARGVFCPAPLMQLIGTLKTEPVGSIIEVLSSDHGSAKDIPLWVAKTGHEHLVTQEKQGYWSIVVKKVKADPQEG